MCCGAKLLYLFSACCEVEALLGGASDGQRVALRDYGLNLGTAFQLIDDLLDFTGSDERLGKASGVDLIEGKLTLPLIYLLDSNKQAGYLAQTVIREGSYSTVPRAALLAAVRESGPWTAPEPGPGNTPKRPAIVWIAWRNLSIATRCGPYLTTSWIAITSRY